jgi:hypothetical protein
MVLDVCERASATEANAREATEALCRQLEYALNDPSRHSTSIYFNSRYGNVLQQLSTAWVRFLPLVLVCV